ncbi:MAG: hypothetical protein AB1714_29210 [Acidobacteriota bacterium]
MTTGGPCARLLGPRSAASFEGDGVSTITGGTGSFVSIRGLMRISTIIDPQAGLHEAEYEGEYWFQE